MACLANAIECLVLGGRLDEARALVARLRSRLPAYRIEDLLHDFRFTQDTERLFRRSARRIGFE